VAGRGGGGGRRGVRRPAGGGASAGGAGRGGGTPTGPGQRDVLEGAEVRARGVLEGRQGGGGRPHRGIRNRGSRDRPGSVPDLRHGRECHGDDRERGGDGGGRPTPAQPAPGHLDPIAQVHLPTPPRAVPPARAH